MKHLTYYKLLEALKSKGCPICTLIERNTAKYMTSFLYESVNDPGVRKSLRESNGFCSRHAWQLKEIGDGLGLSIVYEDLLGGVVTHFENMIKLAGTVKAIKNNHFMNGLKSYTRNIKKSCPVCRLEKSIVELTILTFIESIGDSEFNKLYEQSAGLCLVHLIDVLAHAKNGDTHVQKLLHSELKKMQRLIGELKEFQRKHDYRFSSDRFGSERDSWIRVIEKLVGKKGNGLV